MSQALKFFDFLSLKKLPESCFVICFQAGQYPLLFFTELFQRHSLYHNSKVTLLDVKDNSISSLFQRLSSSFLGEPQWYHLREFSELDKKTQLGLLDYLNSYAGPNFVSLFVPSNFSLKDQENKKNSLIITLPDSLNITEYNKLYTYLYKETGDSLFAQQLFVKETYLSFESLCAIMRYQRITGKNPDFFEEYIPLLIPANHSLFILSQYFFAKQKEDFFKSLYQLEKIYPIEFWLVFWLEQLWQAVIFVHNASKIGSLKSKTLVNRLPFSFLQRDWKNYSEDKLIEAHNQLLKLDYIIKNGGNSARIYNWYFKFLYDF